MNPSIATWYPPAPAAGPSSMLELPPDDWALEPKIDGIRVMWVHGQALTRLGSVLSASKGHKRLCQLLSDYGMTLDGEWVPSPGFFVAFDLPDCELDYDGRRKLLLELPRKPGFQVSVSVDQNFPAAYTEFRKVGAEGVVMKRRRSLYTKCSQPHTECRDWIKRRFMWDS